MARAARHLAMSQPAVSEAMASLENALRVRLLDRSSKGIEPTIYADALLKRGHVVFDELRQGICDQIAGGRGAHLRPVAKRRNDPGGRPDRSALGKTRGRREASLHAALSPIRADVNTRGGSQRTAAVMASFGSWCAGPCVVGRRRHLDTGATVALGAARGP